MTGITPDDILLEEENFVTLNGVVARKGSIAAFLKNIDLLEDVSSSEESKHGALQMIKQLAPVVIASGLYKHATFKNTMIQQILQQASQDC